jgi:hypothetical protein
MSRDLLGLSTQRDNLRGHLMHRFDTFNEWQSQTTIMRLQMEIDRGSHIMRR